MIWALGIYAALATAGVVFEYCFWRAETWYWHECSSQDLHAAQQWKARAIVAEASLSRCIVARDAELAKFTRKRGAGGRFVA